MNEIKLFSNPKFGEIRTIITESNEPIFCLSDICKILDLNNAAMVKSRLNQDGVSTADIIDSMGRTQKASFISESNLYKSIFQSRKPEAEEFTEWVTSEVLPAIRKTGGYIATTIEDTPETILARAVLVAQDSINRLKNQLETREQQLKLQSDELKKQAPKAEYYDNVLDSEGLIATTLIAKDLGMSASALNKKLFAMNVIYNCQGTWVVTAKYQALGFAKSKSFPHHDSKGELHTSIHFYWTQKGREFIIRKLTA